MTLYIDVVENGVTVLAHPVLRLLSSFLSIFLNNFYFVFDKRLNSQCVNVDIGAFAILMHFVHRAIMFSHLLKLDRIQKKVHDEYVNWRHQLLISGGR